MSLHIIRFPRWQDVRSCQRTVMHIPMRCVPNPGYREGDVILAVNDENPQEVAVLHVLKLSVGSLLKFIGDVGFTGLNEELMAVGVNWNQYRESWAKIYLCSAETETNVLRMEFGYEPLPLSKDVVEALEGFHDLYDTIEHRARTAIVKLVLEANKRVVLAQEDKKFFASIGGLSGRPRKNALDWRRNTNQRKAGKSCR